jgi:acyl-CoA synthetase (AMP-forming)/AMP-acid ligase II
MKTIPETLFANPNISDERDAFHWNGAWISYGDFRRRVRRLANALFAAGIRKGDRVAVLLGNCPEYLECYYAITAIGALIVPLNARLGPQEHVAILKNAGPRILISSTDHKTSVDAAADAVGIEKVLMLDEAGKGQNLYEQFLAGEHPDASADVAPHDDAAIIYTSGTTSLPKGVVLTHHNYLSDWYNVSTVYKPMRDGTNLQISPLYHASAVHTLMHVMAGGRTALMKRYDCDRALDQIAEHRATHVFCVPTIIYDFLDNPRLRQTDISSLRTISYGAAPMSLSRLKDALSIFGPIFCHAYGLTETTSHSSLLPGADHLTVFGSVGKALPRCEMAIVDENGQKIAPGQLGEIVIRGENVMSRYWGLPQVTAASIVDGWLHSGDIGREDENGYFFVVDRKKDMIISGGINIYPKDIEQVIAQHEVVGEVAVFGLPDRRWGEAVAAAIRPRPGSSLTVQEIQEHLSDKIGRYQQPKHIFIVDEFPRNGTGKIMKYVLKEKFSAECAEKP